MSRRSYHQYCAIAQALDIVGERWTLLIVRELLIGPKRFKDLLDNLPGIGTNLLTARLRDMEEAGVLDHKTLPPPAGSAVYGLTALGRELEPVLRALHRWGIMIAQGPREGDRFRPGWSIMAMHFAFRPELAKGVKATFEYRIGDDVFHARVNDGLIETRQSHADSPDLILMMKPEIYESIVLQKVTLKEAIEAEKVEVEGNTQLLRQCVEVFGLPWD